MKKLNRTIAAVSALAMSVGALSACGGSNVNADKGHVYFLSMKVEQQDQFKELAEKFTKKTGIQVDIATASSDTYEQSLKSELAKSEAPTLFDVGNNDFLNWTNYYADMSGTNIYKDQENPRLCAEGWRYGWCCALRHNDMASTIRSCCRSTSILPGQALSRLTASTISRH